MRNLGMTVLAAGLLSLVGTAPTLAGNGVACATLRTFNECVRCGQREYGVEKQRAYCIANWKSGQQPVGYQKYKKDKYGN